MFTPCHKGFDAYDAECECMFNQAEVNLRNCFRLLWEQHVYRTRMTIISIAMGLPDEAATTKRLLRNVPDYARLLSHYYDNRAVSEFSRLLKEHLVIAAELVKAAKAGNSQAAADAEKRWYENADQIVYLLNHINPYWSVRTNYLWIGIMINDYL